MKNKLFCLRQWSRVIAVLTVIESLCFLRFWGKLAFFPALSMSLAAGCASLLMLPVTYEGERLTLAFQTMLCALVPLTVLPGLSHSVSVLICSVPPLALLVYRSVTKYLSVDALFSDNSARSELEDVSRLLWLALFLTALLLHSIADGKALLEGLSTAVFAALFPALYYRAYTGRSLTVPASVEEKIYRRQAQLRRMNCPGEDDAARMERIYSLAVSYMENQKPFLSRQFRMDDLAMELGTNRTYLSHTINRMSGKGFPQFVNGYRVKYALELIESDPGIKVKDLAIMCGYNNAVTFSLAFETITGEPPGKYCQKISAEAALRDSSARIRKTAVKKHRTVSAETAPEAPSSSGEREQGCQVLSS